MYFILGAIPLVDSNGELLPLQFPVDPGESDLSPDKNQELSFTDSLSLLNSYLDIVKLDPQVFIINETNSQFKKKKKILL